MVEAREAAALAWVIVSLINFGPWAPPARYMHLRNGRAQRGKVARHASMLAVLVEDQEQVKGED